MNFCDLFSNTKKVSITSRINGKIYKTEPDKTRPEYICNVLVVKGKDNEEDNKNT